jgi:hypothetical protein
MMALLLKKNVQLAKRAASRGVSLQEALQLIEGPLIAEGYDNIIAETRNGTFHWITPARARQLGNKGRGEACELAPDEHYQRIENALLKARYDDFAIATGRGCFRWMTLDRAEACEREDTETEHANEN